VAPADCSENVVVLRGSEHNAQSLLGLRMVDAKLRAEELIKARRLLPRDAEIAQGRMFGRKRRRTLLLLGSDCAALHTDNRQPILERSANVNSRGSSQTRGRLGRRGPTKGLGGSVSISGDPSAQAAAT
jgi:hypothetical protein